MSSEPRKSCLEGGYHRWVPSIESNGFQDPYYKKMNFRCFYCYRVRYDVEVKDRVRKKK